MAWRSSSSSSSSGGGGGGTAGGRGAAATAAATAAGTASTAHLLLPTPLSAPPVPPALPAVLALRVATLMGGTFYLEVPATTTVAQLKVLLFHTQGLPPSQQHLVFRDKPLPDAPTLRACGVPTGATLRLVLGLASSLTSRAGPPVITDLDAYLDAVLDAGWIPGGASAALDDDDDTGVDDTGVDDESDAVPWWPGSRNAGAGGDEYIPEEVSEEEDEEEENTCAGTGHNDSGYDGGGGGAGAGASHSHSAARYRSLFAALATPTYDDGDYDYNLDDDGIADEVDLGDEDDNEEEVVAVAEEINAVEDDDDEDDDDDATAAALPPLSWTLQQHLARLQENARHRARMVVLRARMGLPPLPQPLLLLPPPPPPPPPLLPPPLLPPLLPPLARPPTARAPPTALVRPSTAAVRPPTAPAKPPTVPGGCAHCGRKLTIVATYDCRCGRVHCAAHRTPEKHACDFDYKGTGRRNMAATMPVVTAPKLPKI